jgi:tetratricopeptide (TPR) repeat protein
MWSTRNPPEVLTETDPICDIEDAFDIYIDEDDAIEMYDMNVDEAAKKIIEMKSQGNSDAEAYSARAITKYRRKDYLGAIADFTEAIEMDPNNAAVFLARGDAYYMLKKYREALPDYMYAMIHGKSVRRERLEKCGWVGREK